jgi:hypothetical protein
VKVHKAALVCAGLAIGLGYQALHGQAPARQSAPAAAGSAQVIERGRYMVEIGGCNDCHTAGYAEKGGQAPEADRLKGDTLGYRGPWGTTYPTNLRLTFSKLTEDAWLKVCENPHDASTHAMVQRASHERRGFARRVSVRQIHARECRDRGASVSRTGEGT